MLVSANWMRARSTFTVIHPGSDADDLMGGGPEALQQVIADAQRVGHRRQSGVDRADAGEEARVDDVEVVALVRAAVGVEHRRRGADTEPAGSRLVGAA